MSQNTAAHSVVEPTPWTKRIAGIIVVAYACSPWYRSCGFC